MRRVVLLAFTLILLAGCKKEHNSRVDIYLLRSFNSGIDTTQKPVVNVITNAILEVTPLVADQDIKFYSKDAHTFTLKTNIQSIIQNFGPDKAFAVTVDDKVVYYGVFHPMYLSSMVFGLATIAPIGYRNNELTIDFINLSGTYLSQLDKRNDNRILYPLKATDRLR